MADVEKVCLLIEEAAKLQTVTGEAVRRWLSESADPVSDRLSSLRRELLRRHPRGREPRSRGDRH